MQDEVLEFIQRRWAKDADWTNGNCYWFCHILCKRFPYLSEFYCPVVGHFIAGYDGKFYDWNGVYEPDEDPILFDDIKQQEFPWYERIVNDCVL